MYTKIYNFPLFFTPVEIHYYPFFQLSEANVSKETKQYTYKDGSQFVFMDLVSLSLIPLPPSCCCASQAPVPERERPCQAAHFLLCSSPLGSRHGSGGALFMSLFTSEFREAYASLSCSLPMKRSVWMRRTSGTRWSGWKRAWTAFFSLGTGGYDALVSLQFGCNPPRRWSYPDIPTGAGHRLRAPHHGQTEGRRCGPWPARGHRSRYCRFHRTLKTMAQGRLRSFRPKTMALTSSPTLQEGRSRRRWTRGRSWMSLCSWTPGTRYWSTREPGSTWAGRRLRPPPTRLFPVKVLRWTGYSISQVIKVWFCPRDHAVCGSSVDAGGRADRYDFRLRHPCLGFEREWQVEQGGGEGEEWPATWPRLRDVGSLGFACPRPSDRT